jgi:hypothetical protein
MKLDNYFTEKQTLNLLKYTYPGKIRPLREQLEAISVGRKFWYLKSAVDAYAAENVRDLEEYNRVRRSIEANETVHINLNEYVPVNEVMQVWPYSRERLSQNAKGTPSKIHRLKENRHWFFRKEDVKRWLLEHAHNVQASQAWRESDAGIPYRSYGDWLKAVESW